MRLQLYVPVKQATSWEPAPFITFGALQREVADIAGGVTVLTAFGRWHGASGTEPAYIVEAVLGAADGRAAQRVWTRFKEYADQLLRRGEESVLLVWDHEPTLIR